MDKVDSINNIVASWYGKPLEECTHEELIQCIQYFARYYKENSTPENVRANALGKIQMWKRGKKTI